MLRVPVATHVPWNSCQPSPAADCTFCDAEVHDMPKKTLTIANAQNREPLTVVRTVVRYLPGDIGRICGAALRSIIVALLL